MATTDIRLRALLDTTSTKSGFSDIEKAASMAAEQIKGSFSKVGGIIKNTIGVVGLGVGISHAIESASQLINLQKVQSQLVKNNNLQRQYELQGNAQSTRWYSQRLDQMATDLSLQNGINKADIVRAQNFIIANKDVMNATKSMKDGLNTVLTDSANIAEVTGGNISSTSRMLTRMIADPAKSMGSLRRMGITLTDAQQAAIKKTEKQNGLLKAQQMALRDIGTATKDIAKNAQSPIDLLKNDIQLIWQSLGLGLIPIFESLAQAVIPVVQALMPVLSFMGTAIKDVAETLGTALGKIVNAFAPLLTLLTNSIIPAILNMVTPFIQLVAAIVTPLAEAFAKLVGSGDKLGPLGKLFVTMGDAVNKNLMVGVNAIAKTFKEMGDNGQLKTLMDGLSQAFVTMAPVLPILATSVANLLVALMPLLTGALPAIVYLINVFAAAVAIAGVVLAKIIGVISTVAKNLGPLKGVLEGLAAVWFTRKLFMGPMNLVADGIMGLIGTIGKLRTAFVMFQTAEGAGFLSKLQAFIKMRKAMAVAEATAAAANTGTTVAKDVGGIAGLASKFGGLSSLLLDPWVLAGAAAVAVIVLIATHWKTFLNIVKIVWQGILDFGKMIFGEIDKLIHMYINMWIAYINAWKTVFVDIWHGIYDAFKWAWDGITNGINSILVIFKKLVTGITSIGATMWNGMVNGFIDAINLIIKLWGKIPGLSHIINIKPIQHVGEPPKKKMHSGGIVPGPFGKEVPMMMQAGEAVMSLSSMRAMQSSRGSTLNIHPGAVAININGNADSATVADIKHHVEQQFRELRFTLKTMGR